MRYDPAVQTWHERNRLVMDGDERIEAAKALKQYALAPDNNAPPLRWTPELGYVVAVTSLEGWDALTEGARSHPDAHPVH